MKGVVRGAWALAMVAVGCGEGDSPGAVTEAPYAGFCEDAMAAVESFLASREATWTPPPGDAERYGGTLVAAIPSDLGSGGLNGAVSQDATASEHQMFVGLTTLVRYDADFAPSPYLARSWELSDDKTEITFHLRDDVVWADGVPTTAYDVAFTYETVTNPETGFPNESFWTLYHRGPAGVEVVDSFTVTIRMRREVPELLDAWTTTSILPAHLLGDVPPSELSLHPYGTQCPVGNGPFVFESHRVNERWTFRANPTFPGELGGRPYVDRYVLRIIPEATTRLAELLTGGVDFAPGLPASMADEVIESDRARLVIFPSRNYDFIAWNQRREVLSDRRVRQAIAMVFDGEEAVSTILGGYGIPAYSGVVPVHWTYDSDFRGLPHDPDSARTLLDEAGWIDRDGDGTRENESGEPLEIAVLYNSGNLVRQSVVEMLRANLRDVGISMQPRAVDYGTVLGEVLESRDFDGLALGFATEFKLDDRDLFHSERIEGLYAFAGVQNPVIDALIDSIQVTTDSTVARRLWDRYDEELVREQPFLYLYFPERLNGVSTEVNGFTSDARGDFVGIGDWWLTPEARNRRR